MSGIKKMVEDNPKLSMFILGVVAVLVLVLIVSLFKSETATSVPSVKFLPIKPLRSENAHDPRFFSEIMVPRQASSADLTRPTPHARKPLKTSGMLTPTTRSNPAAHHTENMDSDSVATEHMLSRGGADRAITDSSRTRYLGLAKLGAADYEGYVFQGQPLSDEQGELTATVYGINSSPWETLHH
jgi:hypothetical protein